MRAFLLTLVVGVLAAGAQAQSMASVPATRTLAIGTLKPGWTPDRLRPVMPAEVRDTLSLYLSGAIDQWYIQKDRPGVVFILNETDPVKVKAKLDALPLVKNGLMEFQTMPLGPLAPLGLLIGSTPN